jgi:hypothetical protein
VGQFQIFFTFFGALIYQRDLLGSSFNVYVGLLQEKRELEEEEEEEREMSEGDEEQGKEVGEEGGEERDTEGVVSPEGYWDWVGIDG